MTGPQLTIPRDHPLAGAGASYEQLRAEAVRLTHAMSGSVWTDYNYSDPGITILEQLCYALTELPYRAAFPVAELLSGPGDRRIPLRRHGLMPPAAILPCNPVTAADLRRVVIDRVPGVANAWFTPARGGSLNGLSGLYDIAVLAHREGHSQRTDPCAADEQLIQQVLRTYRRHRALCEDVRKTVILRPVDTIVHARVQLADGADPSDTLAAALFALGLHLAPEPRRRSLADQLAAAGSTAEAFAGPAMLRGFIPDAWLRPLPRAVPVEQLVQLLAETPGIVSVDTLSVDIGAGHHRIERDAVMRAPPDSIFTLQPTGRDDDYTIHLYRDYARCDPDPARVRRRLDQLWSAQRRVYPLRRDYAERFAPPAAVYRDLAEYESVQVQLPNVYGINDAGLGMDAGPMRTAQARQLKGYLMPFDQMLADGFSQIALLRRLFSIEAGGAATYAWQSLRGSVPDADPLLMPGYEAGMDALVAANDPVAVRQGAILDLLLSLYAQQVESGDGGNLAQMDAAAQQALLAAKRKMVRQVASLSANRGRGADYRRPHSVHGRSGMERLSPLQLGLIDPPDDAATDGARWSLADTEEAADFGVRLPAETWPSLERLFRPVTLADAALEAADVMLDASPLAGRRVAPALAEALTDPARYRMGQADGDATIVIVVVDSSGSWWWLGEHDDEARALRMIRQLLEDARRPGRAHDGTAQMTRLYVVDWILLRPAMLGGSRDGARFNFRVTAILSASRAERDTLSWRREAEAVLRQNTPAHVVLDCLFLEPAALARFERLHDAWREAMRTCHQSRLVQTSRALADFLTHAIDGLDPTSVPAPTPAPSPPPPTAAPTPTPVPTPVPTPPPPTPVPTPPPPTPGPPPPPPPPPEPTPAPDPHPIWSWLIWFWQSWVWPVLSALLIWRWFRRRGPTPTAVPPPVPGSTPPPTAAPPPPTPVPPPPPMSAPSPAPPAPTPPPDPEPSPLAASLAPATAGTSGFDCNTVLTASSAGAFRDAGFEFAIRYIPRTFVATGTDSQGNLTTAEAQAILSAGLALMVVQHVAAPPWTPSESLGDSYGYYAAANAQAIGLPRGMILWLDLEGVASGTSAATTTAYCEAWADQVSAAGYVPGIYIGANCGLNASAIEALPFDYYWQSGSSVPALGQTGYCMVQSISSSYVVAGIAYDLDVVQADLDGKTPVWLAPR